MCDLRILYLLQQFPYPPTNGVRWKPYNLLSYMAQRHSCDVLSFGDSDALDDARQWETTLPGLRVLGIFPTRSGASLYPLQAISLLSGWRFPSALRWTTSAFATAVRQALAEASYDIVQIDMINLIYYQNLVVNTPCIFSNNDAVSLTFQRRVNYEPSPFKRLIFSALARRLLKVERDRLSRFAGVHVVSESEAAYLRQRALLKNVSVIEVAADPHYFDLPPKVPDREVVLFTSGAFKIGYIREPLLAFINRYWTGLRQSWGNLRWIIIGRGACSLVKPRLAQQDGIELWDWVDNYASFLQRADVGVFLDAGGTGIKNRVMQALAAGKAVIGTSYALDGIDIQDGQQGFINSDLQVAYENICNLLMSSDLRCRVGQAARELVLHRHSQDHTGQRWEQLYQKVQA